MGDSITGRVVLGAGVPRVYSRTVQRGQRTAAFPPLLLSSTLLFCAAAIHAEPAPDYLGANPYLSDGTRALEMHRYADAIELTRQGLNIEIIPQVRAAALSNLCAGYAGLGKYDLAVVNCSRALALDPDNWQAYNNRALAYLGKGQLRLAKRDVQAGLALRPDSATLQKVDVMVSAAMGKPRYRLDAPDPLT